MVPHGTSWYFYFHLQFHLHFHHLIVELSFGTCFPNQTLKHGGQERPPETSVYDVVAMDISRHVDDRLAMWGCRGAMSTMQRREFLS